MATYTTEILSITPRFDIEAVMDLLQEKRLGGQILEDLVKTFERWSKHLTCKKIQFEKNTYVVVWLDENVEKEIDEKWKNAPETSFRLNCIGQNLIMNTIYQILPEVESAGCAPCPAPNDDLAEALEAENIPYKEGEPTLIRRFSVLTTTPFQGSCEICYLKESCPKANAQGDSFHSVELPGFAQ